jgi:hypothetical protein
MPEPEALKNEGWFNNRWRPAMAWLWFTVTACDFIVFRIFNAIWYGNVYHEYHPITLEGGGSFHLAMGAVVGVATWQRTQEKMAIYNAGGYGGGMMSEHTIETVTPQKSSRAD